MRASKTRTRDTFFVLVVLSEVQVEKTMLARVERPRFFRWPKLLASEQFPGATHPILCPHGGVRPHHVVGGKEVSDSEFSSAQRQSHKRQGGSSLPRLPPQGTDPYGLRAHLSFWTNCRLSSP